MNVDHKNRHKRAELDHINRLGLVYTFQGIDTWHAGEYVPTDQFNALIIDLVMHFSDHGSVSNIPPATNPKRNLLILS